ncbi:hypothetical protein HK105_205404 [Polyrhizophydium stewartii]|uniref:Up-regulated during septation protein 1 domain-containing protein n=1 Tax=Polyrhizophydium stewartii TaxID=2732419 RepID=A0ABR4N6J6_9FUNG
MSLWPDASSSTQPAGSNPVAAPAPELTARPAGHNTESRSQSAAAQVSGSASSLSKKTQKLVQAASMISETLRSLETGLFSPPGSAGAAKKHGLADPNDHVFVMGENVRSIFASQGQQPIFGPRETSNAVEHVAKTDPARVSAETLARMAQLEQENTALRRVLSESQMQTPAPMTQIQLPHSREIRTSAEHLATPDIPPPLAAYPTVQPQMPVFQATRSAAEAGRLVARIEQLEAELAQSKAQCQDAMYQSTTLATKCDALQAQNHDLHMRHSRQALEMKSLSEQNEMLRSESKRMHQAEAGLKTQISELKDALEKARGEPRAANDSVQAPHSPDPPARHTLARESEMTASQQETRDNLVKLADSRLRWLSERRKEYMHSGTASRLSSGPSIFKQLDLLTASHQSLQRLVRTCGDAPNVQSFLTACAEMLDVLSAVSSDVCASFDESIQIDHRIEHLRQESTQVRQETERTVGELTERYHAETAALRGENETLRQHAVALTTEIDQLRRANDEVRASMGMVVAANKEMRSIIDDLQRRQIEIKTAIEPHPLVASLEEMQTNAASESATADAIKDLEAANKSLKSHIAYLEKTIAEWRSENELVRDALKHSEAKLRARDAEQGKLISRIGALENAVHDERLRTQKAVEYAKQLREGRHHGHHHHHHQHQHHRHAHGAPAQRAAASDAGGEGLMTPDSQSSEGASMANLERAFQTHIAAIKSAASPQHRAPAAELDALLAGLTGDSAGDAFEVGALLQLLRDNDNTSQQLAKFGQIVEDMIERANALAEENESLKERMAASKTKHRTRETAWLAKIKTLKQDYARSAADCQQLDQVLSDYDKQFSNMLVFTEGITWLSGTQPMLSHGAASSGGHPFPFASVFATVVNEYVAAVHQIDMLNHRMAELQQSVETKEAQLQAQLAATETLSLAGQQHKAEIHDLQTQAEAQARRMVELQRELKQCEDARRAGEAKLRKIVTAYKAYMTEMPPAACE